MKHQRWLVYVGVIAALVGSIYLGRIATQENLTSPPGWGDAGYGVIQD